MGDFGPTMPFTLTSSGLPFVLLAGDVVVLRYYDPVGGLHTVPLTVVDPTMGTCSYTWVTQDLPAVGFYRGQINVVRTTDSSFPRSWPDDGTTIIWGVWTPFVAPTPAVPAQGSIVNYINGQGDDAPAGQPCSLASTGIFTAATASNVARATVIGITASLITSNNTGPLVVSGPVTLLTTDWDNVTGSSGGLVPNAPYYLLPTGFIISGITNTPNTTSGRYLTYVGYAFSSTTLIVAIQPAILVH